MVSAVGSGCAMQFYQPIGAQHSWGCMPVNFITKIQEGNGEAVAGQQQVCSSNAENLINFLNSPMPNLQEGAEKTKQITRR